MSISPTYLLNVALHAAILSVVANGVFAVMRPASHRSLTAIAGLLAIGVLPWLTALRPAADDAAPSTATLHPAPTLPVWTVVTMKAPAPEVRPIVYAASSPSPVIIPRPAVEKFQWPALPEILVFLWAAGTAAWMLPVLAAWLKVHAWREHLLPVDDISWEKIAPHIDGQIRRGSFLIEPEKTSPCVTGWWNPRIVLPRFLLEENSFRELGWALRHETSHWQAGDSRWMILFCLIRNLNWWNPLVGRLLSRWDEAREQVCDLRAAAGAEHRAEYGEFLIAMSRGITRRTPLTVSMAKMGGGQLSKRIRFLLGAVVGAERPMGKIPLGLVCVWFTSTAVLISGVKIQAEEVSPVNITPRMIKADVENREETTQEKPTTVSIKPTGTPPVMPLERQNALWNVTTELVITPPGFVVPDSFKNETGYGMDDDEKAAAYLKPLVDVLSTTRVTPAAKDIVNGQQSTVELFWPVTGKQGPSAPGAPFVGIKLKLVPEMIGREMELKISSDYRYAPGIPEPIGMIGEGRGDLPPGLDPLKVKTVKHEMNMTVRSGFARFAEIGKAEKGGSIWLFIKAEAIDTRKPEPSESPPSGESPNRQIKLSTKFIISETAMGFTNESDSSNDPSATAPVFTENQMQTIMRSLAQTKGTGLVTAPSVTALSGQQARIEMIRNVPGNSDQIFKRNANTELPFVGVRSVYTSRFVDGNSPNSPASADFSVPMPSEIPMDLAYDVEYHFVPGVHQSLLNNHATPPKDLDPEKIRSIKKSIQCQLNAGMTMGMNLGEIETGKFLSVLVSVDTIDNRGRLIRPSKTAQPLEIMESSPSPETKGKVRLRGTIVDIPSAGGTVAESAPAYPAVAKAILSIPGAKVRKLKTVEIPLFERAAPWPEIRDLKVSAIASPDYKRVNFARWTFEGAGEFPQTWMNLSSASTMNLRVPTDDPAIDRRVLIEIEAVK